MQRSEIMIDYIILLQIPYVVVSCESVVVCWHFHGDLPVCCLFARIETDSVRDTEGTKAKAPQSPSPSPPRTSIRATKAVAYHYQKRNTARDESPPLSIYSFRCSLHASMVIYMLLLFACTDGDRQRQGHGQGQAQAQDQAKAKEKEWGHTYYLLAAMTGERAWQRKAQRV